MFLSFYKFSCCLVDYFIATSKVSSISELHAVSRDHGVAPLDSISELHAVSSDHGVTPLDSISELHAVSSDHGVAPLDSIRFTGSVMYNC